MNNRWWLAPIACVLMAAAPVTPADFDKSFNGAMALFENGQPAEALVALDSMLTADVVPAERGRIELLRFFVLARLERITDARKAIETAIANTEAPTPAALSALFKIRAAMGDHGPAGETLLLIAASDPATLNMLPSELVAAVMVSAHKDAQRGFDLDYALVTAGWSPPDATLGDGDWVKMRLVQGLVIRDRVEEASALVDRILNPAMLIRLGINRRMMALWPQVEKRLGPGADIADAAFVAATKARFDKQPGSLVARLGYAEALNVASREPEAMAVVDVVKTPEELAALKPRELWLVDLHARLLGESGKIEAALARYAALNATPIERQPELMSTVINEALFAASVDRPKEALAAADRADRMADHASDYGKMFLVQARACTLQQLGRASEASALAAPLLKKPEVNREAYLSTLVCLGKMDAAAAEIIRQLGDADKRGDQLFSLQPFVLAPRQTPYDDRERAALRTLKARPDVKAAFLKAGRDLPAAVSPPR